MGYDLRYYVNWRKEILPLSGKIGARGERLAATRC